jgi:predicted nucleotidyltransferase
MARPDARVEARIEAFAREVQSALGDALVCVVLHGSAAGDDWVAGRSDVNTVVVARRLTLDVLERLAPIVARHRTDGFATPVLMDEEYVDRARDTFPMELDDIRRQHRLLVGRDVFTTLEVARRSLRTECEREARGKLLRLRAFFLRVADRPQELERLMIESLKSFLIVLRHLARLRGADPTPDYDDIMRTGEALLGPLPTMRRLLAHRKGQQLTAPELRGTFGEYLAEVERIVAAVDALDG